MANSFYNGFWSQALQGNIDLLTSDIKASIIDLDEYTFDARHQFYSDVAALAKVAVSGNLAGKTLTATPITETPTIAVPLVFDANDITINEASGAISEAVLLWVDSGNAATSPLILLITTGSSGALEIIPNGGNITLQWAAGGIFSVGG